MKAINLLLPFFYVIFSSAQLQENLPVVSFPPYDSIISHELLYIESIDARGLAMPTDSTHEILIEVHPGWNLMSLPIKVSDGRKNVLFPSASSSAFIFQNSYKETDTLESCRGFWLKFDSPEFILLRGTAIFDDTMNVHTGWNMIGSVSGPVAVNAINSIPPGILVSNVFKYNDGYMIADTIYPGDGYWVKASQNGLLEMSYTPPGLGGNPCPDVQTVVYGDKEYKTVQIGNQCWLKENLNIGTMQYPAQNGMIDKFCYNNDNTKCNTYGGLYRWDEAMQYNSSEGAQGICPNGWHIPTLVEFQILAATVSNNGKALQNKPNPNASDYDISGFSALLGGYLNPLYNSYYFGNTTLFWSSTSAQYNRKYILGLTGGGTNIDINNPYENTYSFSVRCIKNGPPTLKYPPDNSVGIGVSPALRWNKASGALDYTLQVSASSDFPLPDVIEIGGISGTSQLVSGLNPAAQYYWRVRATYSDGPSGWSQIWSFTTGTPCPEVTTVDYEGKLYNTVQIGLQCWLRENLNVGTIRPGNQNQTNWGTIEKYCYGNDNANCSIYGGLYQWDEAMKYTKTAGTLGICPPHWHIPTTTEFSALVSYVSNNSNALKEMGQGYGAGTGTNTSGFSALLAGSSGSYGIMSGLGSSTSLWTSNQNNQTQAYWISLGDNYSQAYTGGQNKTNGYSVRCIHDIPPQPPILQSPPDGSAGIGVSLTLVWNSSKGALSYTLQVSASSDFSTLAIPEISGITETEEQVSGLTPSTLYYWRVSAENVEGTSGWSSVWQFTTGTPCPSVATVAYEGKTYNTVQIGTQCWLRENLDVGEMIDVKTIPTDNLIIEKYCYNNTPENCEVYGGLYQWHEAMQYSDATGARGICPNGWHIPTLEEFTKLRTEVAYHSNALKATGQGSGSGSGTNTSGFSALLTGYRFIYGDFRDLGKQAYLGSSTESDAGNAYHLTLVFDNDNTLHASSQKSVIGVSIRCIKDAPPDPPQLKSPPYGSVGMGVSPTLRWYPSGGSSSYTLQVSTSSDFLVLAIPEMNGITGTFQHVSGLNPSTSYYWRVSATNIEGTSDWSLIWRFTTGTPCPSVATVDYGGKTYNTVQIGTQCWLRENLDVGEKIAGHLDQTDNPTIEKYCYDNDLANCEVYGGFYQWDEAMAYTYTGVTRGICPNGWHIPTKGEFSKLLFEAGIDNNSLKAIGEGKSLGAGTNTTGFSVLLAGCRIYSHFDYVRDKTYFWSATENDADNAIPLGLDATSGIATSDEMNKGLNGISVRCLKDYPPEPPQLFSPPDRSIGISVPPVLTWKASGGATSYTLQVSTNSDFSSLAVPEMSGYFLSRFIAGLNHSTKYYWRVSATNIYGSSDWSNVWWFFTEGGGPSHPCPGMETVTYPAGGKTYHTVQIGSQCWLRENLDVGTMIFGSMYPISDVIIEKYCYHNDPANCDIYGGLYRWDEVMEYSTTPAVQGICPLGWRIPTQEDFEILKNATVVNNEGNKLKALGQGSGLGAGTNTTGFSALLAGYHEIPHPYYIFSDSGIHAFFWSSTDYSTWDVYIMNLADNDNSINVVNHSKYSSLSVRCLRNDPPPTPILKSPPNQSTGIALPPTLEWYPSAGAANYTLELSTTSEFKSGEVLQFNEITGINQEVGGLKHTTRYFWRVQATNGYGVSNWSTVWWFFTTVGGQITPCPGIPTVSYAGKIYNTIYIYPQCWLRENLDVGTMIPMDFTQGKNSIIEKYCYNNDPANCEIYGGLYQWDEAMKYTKSEETQGICPPGWHIPSIGIDFRNLESSPVVTDNDRGNALKAEGQGTGNNMSGFSALLAGFSSVSQFVTLGNNAGFWSSTEYDEGFSNILLLDKKERYILSAFQPKRFGQSVRCVNDFNALAPLAPVITHPPDKYIDAPVDPLLQWTRNPDAQSYGLLVSTDSVFSDTVYIESDLTDTSQQIPALSYSTRYFWRVRAVDSLGLFNWSATCWFITCNNPCPSAVDYAGKVYNTIQIGDQCWLKENLNAGTMVDSSQDQTNNDIMEKYCYGNDTASCDLYGGLYQWNEAMGYSTVPGSRGVCPPGWHLPTAGEFDTLNALLGDDGNALKEVGQGTGDGAGTNASGFSALLVGYWTDYGVFSDREIYSEFWSSTDYYMTHARSLFLSFNESTIYLNSERKGFGVSIRCIKD